MGLLLVEIRTVVRVGKDWDERVAVYDGGPSGSPGYPNGSSHPNHSRGSESHERRALNLIITTLWLLLGILFRLVVYLRGAKEAEQTNLPRGVSPVSFRSLLY